MYDLIIIGGGPAGSAAAVYAARKQLKTLLIVKEWGGQSIVSEDIQNWIGTPHISGAKLAESLKAHVLEYKGEILSVHEGSAVKAVSGSNGDFSVTLENQEVYRSKTVLVSTGSSRRTLDIEGATQYEHKGITYCASCDGPLFTGMDVVVIGGGNAGFESAAQLLAYCKSVTLLSRSEPKADAITVEKLLTKNNFTLLKNVIPQSVSGDTFVTSVTYVDTQTKKEITLPTSAIFVEIGQIASTSFVENIVEMTHTKNIIINPRTQETSTKGIWAAGDCTDILYHQNNIAAGDAVRALEDIYLHLHA
ncbi:MAG: FAD-dependent oxidoreductase [Candidatus Pacebacteria bacterium]|nr:FAD-dependent oxidoreductase [Candidatus Paceibacterota bacterium]MBP9866466.1 FAD-dependent oxidoreductase [Candidatus Paceibacterota bacterium]